MKSHLVLFIFLTASLNVLPGAELDDESLRDAGFRKLSSKHLTLYTDLPKSEEVDALPGIFDQAVPQWAQFFDSDPKRLTTWHVEACLMKNSQRFVEYRLMPQNLPDFKYGLQRHDRLWVHEQPSAYYRRHLLLHEGTHAVMNRIFGRVGPVWYREGIAEMLGTHQYQNGKLTLNVFPRHRDEVEYWGRIKIIHDDIENNGIRQIAEIVGTPTRAFVNSDAYGWSWALQSFLYQRPEYKELRRSMFDAMLLSDRRVTETFLAGFQKQRAELDYDWNLYIEHLDYGYDSSNETITFAPEKVPLPDEIVTVKVDTAKPWQSTGLIVPPNTEIEIAARGRYQLVEEKANSPAWICEPQGVTIEYYQGRR